MALIHIMLQAPYNPTNIYPIWLKFYSCCCKTIYYTGKVSSHYLIKFRNKAPNLGNNEKPENNNKKVEVAF